MKKIFKCKNLFLVTFLAIAGFFSAAAIIKDKQVEETSIVEEAKADVTTEANFSRFYFCQGSWGNSDSAVISKTTLASWTGVSSFVLTSTGSSRAALGTIPDGCYYFIDYEINDETTLYFRFKQGNNPIYPDAQGYSGYIGNKFYPGFIYTITAGDYTGHDEGNPQNKWCKITVAAIGYIGSFNVNGGTRTSSYDYKEFRNNTATALFSAPTRSGYTFNGWKCNKDGFVTKAGGNYTASARFMMTAQWVYNTQTVIPKDYARIWIGYNGSLSEVFYKEKATIKIKINNYSYTATGTYYNMVENVSSSPDCPRRYDYFDVPKSCFNNYSMNVERFDESGTSHWTTSKFYVSLNTTYTDWAFKVFYCPNNWETGVVTIGGLAGTTSHLATLGLCGIHTCENGVINGYAGYEYYYDTFVQSDSVRDYMTNYTIMDYRNGDTSQQGERDRAVNALIKHNSVYNMTQSGNPNHASVREFNPYTVFVGTDNDAAVILIIVVSSISILSITALSVLLVKKRKSKQD